MTEQIWQTAVTWTQDGRAVLAVLAALLILASPHALLRRLPRRDGSKKKNAQLNDTRTGPKTHGVRKGKAGTEPWPRFDLVTPADCVTLAALPFEMRALKGADLSSVEGFEQDLVNLLRRAPVLEVRPVSYARSAAAVTGTPIPIDARYLLEGCIHTFPVGPRMAVHIIIHIIETATGESIFVETFEGPVRGLAGLMDEVTEAVYGALTAMVEMPPAPFAPAGPTQSQAALALHNRSARVLNIGLSHQRLDETVRLLDHACRIDPGFVSAKRFLMTAIAIRMLTLTSPDEKEDYAAMAELSKALSALDQPSARLSSCIGLMHLARQDFKEAKNCFADALQREPGALDAPIYLAWTQLLNDEDIRSIAAVEACLLQSDSQARNAIARHVIALFHLQQGEYQSAREVAELAIKELHAFHMNWLLLGLALALQGNLKQAANTFFRARRIMGPHDQGAVTAWVERAAGSRNRAREWRKAFDRSWKP